MVTQTDLLIGGAVALAVAGIGALAFKQTSDIFGNIKESIADITGPIEAVTTAVKGAGQGVVDFGGSLVEFGVSVKKGASEPTYVTLKTIQGLKGYESTKEQFNQYWKPVLNFYPWGSEPTDIPPSNVIGSPRNTKFGPIRYVGPGPENYERPFTTFDSNPLGEKVGEVAGRFWNYATNSWEGAKAGGGAISFIPFFGAWLDKKVGNLDA